MAGMAVDVEASVVGTTVGPGAAMVAVGKLGDGVSEARVAVGCSVAAVVGDVVKPTESGLGLAIAVKVGNASGDEEVAGAHAVRIATSATRRKARMSVYS